MTSALTPPPAAIVDPIIKTALAEDLGRGGDVTTEAVVPDGARAEGAIVSRAEGVVAGLSVAARVFSTLDPTIEVRKLIEDGRGVATGTPVAEVAGFGRSILTAERTALNLLGRLSGIATATRRLVEAVAGTGAKIADTRKTAPGLRALDKYAVRAGGGINHRFGLDDAVMIKDNHIVAAGGIAEAVRRARDRVGHTMKIEVEVDDLDQLGELLEVGADIVLLDNMDPATLRKAVELVDGRMITEASGGVTLGTVRAIAESGVDVVSAGWITHSAPALDVGLDLSRRS